MYKMSQNLPKLAFFNEHVLFGKLDIFWASLWKLEMTLHTSDQLCEWVGLVNLTKTEKIF